MMIVAHLFHLHLCRPRRGTPRCHCHDLPAAGCGGRCSCRSDPPTHPGLGLCQSDSLDQDTCRTRLLFCHRPCFSGLDWRRTDSCRKRFRVRQSRCQSDLYCLSGGSCHRGLLCHPRLCLPLLVLGHLDICPGVAMEISRTTVNERMQQYIIIGSQFRQLNNVHRKVS